MEQASENCIELSFCPGRSDAVDGKGSKHLSPYLSYNTTSIREIDMSWSLAGLTFYELIALQGRPRSTALMLAQGYSGSYLPMTHTTSDHHSKGISMHMSLSSTPITLNNKYFTTLLAHHINRNWIKQCRYNKHSQLILCEYVTKAPAIDNSDTTSSGSIITGATVYMTPLDMNLVYKSEFRAVIEDLASNNTLFLESFVSAWNKLMSLDRFDGPFKNLCSHSTTTTAGRASASLSTVSSEEHHHLKLSKEGGIVDVQVEVDSTQKPYDNYTSRLSFVDMLILQCVGIMSSLIIIITIYSCIIRRIKHTNNTNNNDGDSNSSNSNDDNYTPMTIASTPTTTTRTHSFARLNRSVPIHLNDNNNSSIHQGEQSYYHYSDET